MSSTHTPHEHETLSPAARFGESLILPAMLLLFGFLYLHQMRGTGFFTEEFGTLEQAALYAPIFLALIAPTIRVVTGQRNPSRPAEMLNSLALMLGSLWLLIVFPFDYSHLADVLPGGLQWTLSWVTDWMARAVLIIQVIAGPLGLITNIIGMVRHGQSGMGRSAHA